MYSYRVPPDFEAVDPIEKGETHLVFVTSAATPATTHTGAGIVVGQIQDFPQIRSAADLHRVLPELEAGINGRDFSIGQPSQR
jgi:hypothetical protein